VPGTTLAWAPAAEVRKLADGSRTRRRPVR
jgi:hypothetical protein